MQSTWYWVCIIYRAFLSLMRFLLDWDIPESLSDGGIACSPVGPGACVRGYWTIRTTDNPHHSPYKHLGQTAPLLFARLAPVYK